MAAKNGQVHMVRYLETWALELCLELELNNQKLGLVNLQVVAV